MATPIKNPRKIFSPLDPPVAMPMNFFSNKSSTNESPPNPESASGLYVAFAEADDDVVAPPSLSQYTQPSAMA